MHRSARPTNLRLTILAAALAVVAIAVPVALAATPTTVAAAHNAKLGTILVNSQGRTLYTFSKGTACTGSCASTWKPLLGKSATAKSGAQSKLVGSNGKQITYDHYPLYTYSGDHASGQANGAGKSQFGGKWYALSTSGKEISGGDCHPVCVGY